MSSHLESTSAELIPVDLVEINETSWMQEVVSNTKRGVGRCMLALSLVAGSAVGIGTSEAMLAPTSAEAATTFVNDYPDMDATDCSAIYGQYSWCKGSPATPHSPRGYDYRNCTDGADYWTMKYTGVDVRGWGNANTWNTSAAKANYAVYSGNTNSVEPGDIAQDDTGTYGHVGFVTDVTKDTNGVVTSVTVAELNKDALGDYSHDTYTSKNAAGDFIRNAKGSTWDHFIDVNGPGKGLNNEVIGGNTSSAKNKDNPSSDFDNNGNSDLSLTAKRADGTADERVMLSTGVPQSGQSGGLLEQGVWQTLSSYGFDGITPLVGDVTGDGSADYVFITNEGANGIKVFVAAKNSTGLSSPVLWWSGPGYGYTGIKANMGDMNGDGKADLVLTAETANGTANVLVLTSTGSSFNDPGDWRTLDTYGWNGITPLVADVNGDGKDDYVFLTNEGANGTKAFVALANSTGTGTLDPQLWWDGTGYGYTGIKATMGDVNGDKNADLVLTTLRGDGTADGLVLPADPAASAFDAPQHWLDLSGYGWNGITPFTADMNGDGKADYAFITNEGANGIKVFVAPSLGGSFGAPQQWYSGGYDYNGIKPVIN